MTSYINVRAYDMPYMDISSCTQSDAHARACALCLVNLGQVVLEGCQDGSVVIDEHFRCVTRTTAARTDVMRR